MEEGVKNCFKDFKELFTKTFGKLLPDKNEVILYKLIDLINAVDKGIVNVFANTLYCFTGGKSLSTVKEETKKDFQGIVTAFKGLVKTVDSG